MHMLLVITRGDKLRKLIFLQTNFIVLEAAVKNMLVLATVQRPTWYNFQLATSFET